MIRRDFMEKKILIVDDEQAILNSLKRVFARSDYNIFIADHGEKGLDILAQERIDLVITDINMPGMSGCRFLRQVKKKYPWVIRLVLSGHMEEDLVLNIKQKNLAKLYLLKPWKNKELLCTVEHIFEGEELLKNKNLFEIINGIDFLPSSENIYTKINTLIEQEAGMNQIAQVIERDPSIAAKILEIINSAFYGIKTGSIKQAIKYIGLTNIKSIVFNMLSYGNFNEVKDKDIYKDMKTIWDHSIITNQIVTFLYKRVLNKKIPENATMAGLLHDIGKVVLINNFTTEYLERMKKIRNNVDPFYFFEEMEFLEVSHEEIGGFLLNWWELPLPIVEAALFHHNPMDDQVVNRELVSLVHIADICSWNLLFKKENREIDPRVLKFLDLTKERVHQLLKELDFIVL